MFNMIAKYKQRKKDEQLKETQTIIDAIMLKHEKEKEEIVSKFELQVEEHTNKKLEEIEKAKIDAVEATRKAKEEEDRLAELALTNRRKKVKESKEPYLEIVAEKITEQGLKLEMDWNKPMIKYLKKSGFKGNSEEEIVFKYMSAINREVQLDEIAEKYVGTVDDDDAE